MLSNKLEVRESSMEGLGVFAKEKILKGEVIYRLSDDARKVSLREKKNFPLAYRWEGGVFIQETDQSDRMNHCCHPNTMIDESVDFPQWVAMRDIEPGEEITYDYATTEFGPYTMIKKLVCKCGNCRGVLHGFDCYKLPKDIGVSPFIRKVLRNKGLR